MLQSKLLLMKSPQRTSSKRTRSGWGCSVPKGPFRRILSTIQRFDVDDVNASYTVLLENETVVFFVERNYEPPEWTGELAPGNTPANRGRRGG